MLGAPPKSSTFRAEFARSFVATRYFLGARQGLASPLGDPGPEAAELVGKLERADRQRRAEALAHEMGLVVRALERRMFR